MLDLITTGATFLFPGGRALKLIKNGVCIYNSTNVQILTKNITLTVLDCCCAPPPARLLAHCVVAGVLIVASVTTPNVVTIGSAIHIVSEIYEKC
jgi:hypothetical protein